MKNFIRDNSKKLLAVFGVILMIAFILPSDVGRFTGRGARRLAGHVGERKVYDTDIDRAAQRWMFLDKFIVIAPSRTPGEIRSIGQSLRQIPVFRNLADQLVDHPELYYLLEQEADAMGVMIAPGRVDAMFRESGWEVRLPEGNIVHFDQISDPSFKAVVRESAATFLKLNQSLDRAIATVKVSQPRRDHLVALNTQQLQVAYVPFATSDFIERVPAPTADELRQHFERFSEYLPKSGPSAPNPHGFGYKYPNRVTLQYIGVRRSDVEHAVRSTQSAYDWDVAANKQYLRNPARYQTDPLVPSTTTQPATQPGTTQPTTQPFHLVREEIIAELMEPDVQRRMRDVHERINSRLRADFLAWQEANAKSGAAGGATTAPTTKPGGFTSYEYLQQLAGDIQKQTGILPVIGAANQLQDQEQLQALEGIGQAATSNGMPFGFYATQGASAFIEENLRATLGAIDLYQPSQTVRDVTGSTYLFRITGAAPSAPPKSADEIAQIVQRDYKISRAYELARAAGQELMRAAENQPLDAAAAAAGLNAKTTAPFGLATRAIENLSLPDAAQQRFRIEAMDLLSVAATRPASPLKLIELPVEQYVVVTKLLSAQPNRVSPESEDIDAEQQLRMQAAQSILERWFNYNAVITRTGWKPEVRAAAESAR